MSQADIELFRGRTGQYVFISSASAYQTPPARMPVVESTPLRNPYWQYSRDKIACEDLLVAAYREEGFPATIVRPSHTYDQTLVPFDGGWTVIGRMRAGQAGHRARRRDVVVDADPPRRTSPAGSSRCSATRGRSASRSTSPPTRCSPGTRSPGAGGGAGGRRPASCTCRRTRSRPPTRLGRGAARRQGALDGVRQRQAARVVPGCRAAIPFEQGARRDRRLVRLADPARQVTDQPLDAVMDKLAAAWSLEAL